MPKNKKNNKKANVSRGNIPGRAYNTILEKTGGEIKNKPGRGYWEDTKLTPEMFEEILDLVKELNSNQCLDIKLNEEHIRSYLYKYKNNPDWVSFYNDLLERIPTKPEPCPQIKNELGNAIDKGSFVEIGMADLDD